MLDRLVILNGTDAEREHHLNFSDGPVIVGRSNAQARIVVPDVQVSRIHFQIEQRDGKSWVVDLNSSSGTLVNGRKVSTHQLQPGDTIRIGETQMRFVSAGVQHTAGEESAESRLESLVGTAIGRFQIKRLIARGTSGCVFEALEDDSGQTVALKVLFPELAKHEEERQRFIRAMKTIMPLVHPNLVTLYGAGRKGEHCWVSMEYVEGESLAKMIERVGKDHKLPWKLALRVAVHIARAIDYAEEHGILHRNITPNNILIRTKDQNAMLGDLMLAKALEGTLAAQITKPGQVIGDIHYMSPERTRSTVEVDGRSEIFSLGATIYNLITGRTPNEGLTLVETMQKIRSVPSTRPSVLQPQLPAEFDNAIMKMLAKKPEDRFQTASELIQVLEQIAKKYAVSL